MSAAFSAIFRLSGETVTPFSLICSISFSSAQGSMTTPLPMIDSLSGRTTPEGSRLRRYSTLPMTRVWPALWPPWKRTTTSARCDSQSTILPLPSSPHWAPITATFAISAPRQPIPRRRARHFFRDHDAALDQFDEMRQRRAPRRADEARVEPDIHARHHLGDGRGATLDGAQDQRLAVVPVRDIGLHQLAGLAHRRAVRRPEHRGGG